jgi:hypothetical protein
MSLCVLKFFVVKGEAKTLRGDGMDVAHISTPSRSSPARFSATPVGRVGLIGIPKPDKPTPARRALLAQAPTPSSRPYCPLCRLCLPLIDFRHNHNIITGKLRQNAQNSDLNAT